jgi:hypothetical protein
MQLDQQNLFSDQQAVTAAANSTNVIDLRDVRDIGAGEGFYIMVQVNETLDDAGDDSTLAIALVTDDNAALSSPATIRTLVTLPALTAAGTTLYYKIEAAQLVAFQRYLGLVYTPANGNLSAGKITAGIVRNIQQQGIYPASGYSIT